MFYICSEPNIFQSATPPSNKYLQGLHSSARLGKGSRIKKRHYLGAFWSPELKGGPQRIQPVEITIVTRSKAKGIERGGEGGGRGRGRWERERYILGLKMGPSAHCRVLLCKPISDLDF